MAINTVLLDLSVDPRKISERNALQTSIQEVLSKFIPELKQGHSTDFGEKGFLAVYTAVRETFVTVRGFSQGLVSINIEYYLQDGDSPLLPFETVRRLESTLTKSSGSIKSHKYPALKRGGKIDRYFLSSDERIMEYDMDYAVFEEQSPYQHVQILHSTSLGNCLLLDELHNMSERDLIYTETLMQRGKEDYSGKEIVILGGGDGALLYELLKEKPKFVTMLELDEVVLRACREHLRSCCGDCLDQFDGPNYKIVVGDCLIALDEMISKGKKVDYIFGALTDIPVSITPRGGEVWDFIKIILNKAMQVLKPTGKYLTHGNGVSSTVSLAIFEDLLKSLKIPVEFTTDKAFIPSFLEDWVFYQVWLKQVN